MGRRETLVLSLVNEVLFFAGMALVPAVIPVMAILLIAHGRLVYPVYGIRVSSAAVAEYVVAVFYGGMPHIPLQSGPL